MDPTPEEINQRCQAIRATWNHATEQSRRFSAPSASSDPPKIAVRAKAKALKSKSADLIRRSFEDSARCSW
jgi:hypothetical protein